MIKTVTLQDLLCFEGEHIIDFDPGLNTIQCDRVKRDDFYTALLLAHSGGTGYPSEVVGGVVNGGTFLTGARSWDGGLVDIRYAENGVEYIVKRKFSPLWAGVREETVIYSMENPFLRSRSWSRLACVEEFHLGEESHLSSGCSMLKALKSIIRLNQSERVGFMVLHDSLISFTEELYIEALQALGSLEQVVLMDNRYSGDGRVIRLGEVVDAAVFKVHGSPGDPMQFLESLDVLVYNRYLCTGDQYTVSTDEGPMVVEAVMVLPDGGRYVRGVSRIELSERLG